MSVVDVMNRPVVNGDLVVPMGIVQLDTPALVYDDMLYAVHEFIDRDGMHCLWFDKIDTGYTKTRVYKIDRALCTRRGTPERHALAMTLRELHSQPTLPLSRRMRDHMTSKQKLIPGHAYIGREHTLFLYIGRCGFMDTKLETKTGYLIIEMPLFKPRRVLVYGRTPLETADFMNALMANVKLDAHKIAVNGWARAKLLTSIPTRTVGDLGQVDLPTGSVELWRLERNKQVMTPAMVGVVKRRVRK